MKNQSILTNEYKLYDEWAEEIKGDNNKPYNFISEKIKNEVVSKHKILEKHNPNWINESESGNTLSYSKVFGTSSREYAKMGDQIQNMNQPIKEEEIHETRENWSRKDLIT